jgi:hypothetical protein
MSTSVPKPPEILNKIVDLVLVKPKAKLKAKAKKQKNKEKQISPASPNGKKNKH